VSTNPDFVLCDEPISALDVSIQAQVVNMLEDLQKEMGLTYLFVAHDLSMVRHISDRIGVMYLGSIVEVGRSNDLYKNPLHPYTKGLLTSIPIADPLKSKEVKRNIIEGDIPSPINIPKGCRFHTRCPYAKPICAEVSPVEKAVDGDHLVACHLY
jgi:oligopeptide transport system ATP-binding protein